MGLEDDIASVRADISEVKSLTEQSKRPRVLDFLVIETRRLETRLTELLKKQVEAPKLENGGTTATAVTSKPKVYDVQIKQYSWDQSENFVKIYLTDLKNVQSLTDLSNDFEFQITPKSVHFVVKNLDGRNCVFDLKETAGKMNPEKSEFKVKTNMVVLMLKKYETEKWSHLKMSDKRSANKDKPKLSSSAADDSSADPSASLMSMMKQMYTEGDDDMKRTIAKAWTESQGGAGAAPGPAFDL